MRFQQFRSIVKARTMEFIRDRETFIWNIFFPIIMVAGFAIIFSTGGNTLFKAGLIGSGELNFTTNPQIEFISYASEEREKARKLVQNHKLDILIDFENSTFLINRESKNGLFLHRLFLIELKEETIQNTLFTEEHIEGDVIRYVDWLVPGVIGMNLMFSCLFGVGYVLVRYRKNGVLKRIKATPVDPIVFLAAQAASRLFIVLATSVVIYTGTNFVLHFVMKGSYFDLFILTTLGVLCMISLGLLFASRIKSEELASGLINLVTFPMILFSEVFVSLEGAPSFVRSISKVFPLTHVLSGARQIMLEGASLESLLPSVLYLVVLTIVFLTISAFTFSWE